MDPRAVDGLEGRLRGLYEGKPLGSVPHEAVPTPTAPATTDTAVCYLGFGKYVLYIVSVDAVAGLGDAVADAPERFAGLDRSTLPPHFDEMHSLQWVSIPALLQAAADQTNGSEAGESCFGGRSELDSDSDHDFESESESGSYNHGYGSGSDSGSSYSESDTGVFAKLLSVLA